MSGSSANVQCFSLDARSLGIFQRKGLKLDKDLNFSGIVQNGR